MGKYKKKNKILLSLKVGYIPFVLFCEVKIQEQFQFNEQLVKISVCACFGLNFTKLRLHSIFYEHSLNNNEMRWIIIKTNVQRNQINFSSLPNTIFHIWDTYRSHQFVWFLAKSAPSIAQHVARACSDFFFVSVFIQWHLAS